MVEFEKKDLVGFMSSCRPCATGFMPSCRPLGRVVDFVSSCRPCIEL
jgi:hypothetical protein